MKILAVDTSTGSGSVALVEGRRLKAEWTLDSAITHNRRLLKSVDEVLERAGWRLEDLEGFAVTAGPGSFTGLRIGMSTVKSLAWSLAVPLAGIGSLEALAAPFGFSTKPVCAVIDARKKEVFAALYRGDGEGRVRLEAGPLVAAPERAAELVEEPVWFMGDGWLSYGERFREILGERASAVPAPYHTIRAAVVAELALRRFEAGERDNPLTLVPLYVRQSEAELHHPGLAESFLSGI
jgi:tRNA threonylcarbamoyladenosine biosynthesis protein TsaB